MKTSDYASRLSSCVLFLSLALAVGSGYADISEGLVGHWKFDETSGETAEDISGNDNHGTIYGTAQWMPGHIRGGLDLDGTNDYVELPIGSLISTLTNSTFATWVDFSNEGGAWQRIFDFGTGTMIYMFLTPRIGTADPMRFAITVGGGGDPEQMATAPSTLPSGWHHVAVTIDGDNGTISLYLDGLVVADNTAATLTPSDLGETTQNWLGRSQYSADAYFDGSLDDFRIYNRILSQAEIEELMDWTGGAYAGEDRREYGGDRVTLTGIGPGDATSFAWQQVAGEPQVTLIPDPPNQAEVEFDAPELEIGTLLTFRLTVDAPSTGVTTDDIEIIITAINVPRVAPSNLQAFPMDFGGGDVGFRLTWDPVLDAERYMLAMKVADTYVWQYNSTVPQYEFRGMFPGVGQTVAVRGENAHSGPPTDPDPTHHGVQSEDVTYTAMGNIASAAAATPPSERLAVVTPGPAEMNNGATDDHNDSAGPSTDYGGPYYGRIEDWWGYQWDEAIWLDHVVYYTGESTSDGGWFTSLRVQVTEDGITWTDVPGATIAPEYDFSDTRGVRQDFTRYDIMMPPMYRTGIRIYGTPGGRAQYTSVAELQVFGDQTRPGDFIQAAGADGEVLEGSTGVLDGTASFSLAGDIVSYAWSGPVSITDADKALASFDAANVSADEVLVFSLTVEDSTAQTATDDDVRITVKNVATTAKAGLDRRVLEGDEVTLDGSASLTTTDTISYLWTQTAGTLVGVTGSTTETVTFTAPVLWGFMEELTFEVQVNDGATTDTDEVTVTVYNFVGTIYPLGSGYFKNLLHMGEDTTDRITSPVAINSEILEKWGGEANVNPRPGEAYDFSDTTVQVTTNPMIWTPEYVDDGWFAYHERPEHVLDWFEQIYHIYIISPEDRDVLWYFWHDNELRVHNNGVLAVSRDGWDSGEMMRAGPLATNRGLNQGVNSVAIKFATQTGGNYMALRVADLDGNEFTDLEYSLGPPFDLADAYAARTLPLSYEPGGSLNVDLSLRVNLDNVPGSVNIMENVPAGISDADVTAPGATVSGGKIIWTLSGDDVETKPISYSMVVPADMTQGIDFSGTVSFGTTTGDIFGHDVAYARPSAPRYVEVEMLAAAHLSWSAPPEEGVSQYRIFRSADGGAYQEIATVSGTSYVDMLVEAGVNYSYQVSAINVRGFEGPASTPTAQATLPVMEVRQAEDFNYGGGLYPGPGDIPAVEATAQNDLAEGNDFWHPNKGGPKTYRPLDDIGIWTAVEPATGQENMGIGWTYPGSWWRYTFDVPEPGPGDPPGGWVKLAFRIASLPNQPSTLTAYWDETPVGTVSFEPGPWMVFTYAVMEQFQTDPGEHTLRVEAGGANATVDVYDFDKIAVGYNWTPPRRKTMWEDDFELYASTQEVIDNGGWEIINGSTDPDTGDPAPTADGAWKLWDVDTPLSGETNIAGMDGNYMVSNSDDSGQGFLLNEELISPEIDCAGWAKLRLNFSKNYRIYDDPDYIQNADADIRVWDEVTGWGDWVTLVHLDTSSVPTGLDPPILSDPEQVDISAYDGKTIQLRFHFYDAMFDYYFAVDDVRVSGIQPEGPPPSITGWTYDGTNVSITWEAFGDGTYYVEYTTDLSSGLWQEVAGPLTETTWSTEMPGDAVGYARVRSAAP